MINPAGLPLLSAEYGLGLSRPQPNERAHDGMIDTLGLGLKGGLLLAVGLVAAYLVFTWLRLRKVSKRSRAKAQQAKAAGKNTKGRIEAPKTPPVYVEDEDDDEELAEVVTYSRPRAVGIETRDEARPSTMAADPGFAALLGETQNRNRAQERELETLRGEVATLRQGIETLQGELDRVKAAQAVSPLYNEAVGLAQHGIDAEGIATRCGISIAEAQLVEALSNKKRNRKEAGLDDLYGDDYGTERHYERKEKQYAAA